MQPPALTPDHLAQAMDAGDVRGTLAQAMAFQPLAMALLLHAEVIASKSRKPPALPDLKQRCAGDLD
ncbi:MAG: hypothetical protein E2576_11130 [Alcaligenaceae bacterium]|nr:hypothetical protein [Alcaligenaceae bacterium SAGV5]MPS51239.1 hypothetical protein [Alcaligenaceae bacterium SAGV3]MPT57264.1 hypothetical protein [Alcaligenaceae bacterium]